MDRENQPFEFGIIRILDCGFFIEEAVLNERTLEIGYGMHFVYDIENDWVQFNIRTDFKQIESHVLFISGTVLTKFNIKNLKRFVNENGKLILPKNTLETLFSISFGHMRAILAKNIAGSRFMNLIVPPINPSSLFHDLLKSNIQQLKKTTSDLGGNIDIEEGVELFEITKATQFLAKSSL